MRKILLACTVAMGVALGGCSTLQTISSALTGTYSNITPTQLKQAEDAMTIIFAGLNAYKKTCVQGVIPATCKSVIRNIQVYTRQIPPLLRELRAFVKGNDQVNAVTVYTEIQRLFGLVKTQAAANGIATGG